MGELEPFNFQPSAQETPCTALLGLFSFRTINPYLVLDFAPNSQLMHEIWARVYPVVLPHGS
jgi:hypothetical protein